MTLQRFKKHKSTHFGIHLVMQNMIQRVIVRPCFAPFLSFVKMAGGCGDAFG